MAYKLEREQTRVLELEVNGEILKVSIGGMGLYRKVLSAQERLYEIQQKIEAMNKAETPITAELVNFLGDAVIFLFNTAFGEANTEKILKFYDGNSDEMLLKIYPFFLNEYLPALKGCAKEESRKYAEELARIS